MANSTACPICDGSLMTDVNTIVGELLECMDCGGELVVNSLAPLSIEEAPSAEEDWGE